MEVTSKDSLKSLRKIQINNKEYSYFDLKEAANALGFNLSDLPYSMRVLFENTLRMENGSDNDKESLNSYKGWLQNSKSNDEISLKPARVLMQDFTGVPAVVDLAAMRDAKKDSGGNPILVNPQIPVDLVIDHSIQVDKFGSNNSYKENVKIEMERNKERYQFLKWGQKSFDNFRVVPPGAGICHQVNLEHLAHVVFKDGDFLYPDIVVGTDSHTTMVNALSVLGWGVGGIEAESAMLGRTIPMILPEVIGVKISGKMPEGLTATDVVLEITNKLRSYGVVSKFVEFCGDGVKNLSLADRATIANMAPEYGATCGFFPIDEETISYLRLTARSEEQIEIIEQYSKKQNLWFDPAANPKYTDVVEVDLNKIEPALAGPKRPQDKILLRDAKEAFLGFAKETETGEGNETIDNGDIVIAAITSCTNTSNPSVLIAAGLVAKKASQLGMKPKKHVKASLAPGSKVVTEYLEQSGLQQYLDELGFNLVGYGCTTCIGNSGPLAPEIEKSIKENQLLVTSVLSGNRNFEGRVHPLTKANYLTSPPLVVAYALAGSMKIDVSKDPISNVDGKDIYLKDLWPSNKEIAEIVEKVVSREMFAEKYKDVFEGDSEWQSLKVDITDTYSWDDNNTYIKKPPYFTTERDNAGNIKDASLLALFGDSVTTDHISPAGNIAKDSPAGKYLLESNIPEKDFNSYGARRGNHEVMMRGTFANVRIKNELCPGTEGGVTLFHPNNKQMSIYDAAMLYQESDTPLVVIGGKEYGTGSSRDWAAKGTTLLGVRAVIVESFERIHRSNLVGMGVLPFTFVDNVTKASLNLAGSEKVTILDLEEISKRKKVRAKIGDKEVNLELQLYTDSEVEYIKNKGILQTVLKHI
jgi:aconitate hydratase